jgi:hypothetical protein
MEIIMSAVAYLPHGYNLRAYAANAVAAAHSLAAAIPRLEPRRRARRSPKPKAPLAEKPHSLMNLYLMASRSDSVSPEVIAELRRLAAQA